MKNLFYFRNTIPFLFLFFSVCSKGQTVYKDYPDFEKLMFSSPSGSLPYRLLKPIQYDPQKKYPLLIFFHGAGERGVDNVTPITHIAPLFLNGVHRKNYPCFVLVPQCPADARWVETDWTLAAHDMPKDPSKPMSLSMELLHKVKETYSIDSHRVYVTGLSMGGFGAWDAMARYPNEFAAAIPICGGGDVKTAEIIKNIPIWAFHGKLDQIVKPSRSRDMILAIRDAGGVPKYTEYPNVGHDSWKPAYEEPKLLEWLFAQKKEN